MKRNKENKIAQNIKSNPKAFYQYVASKTTKKEGIYGLTDKDGNITNDDLKNVKF